jgi:hypothetical protein
LLITKEEKLVHSEVSFEDYEILKKDRDKILVKAK